MLSKNINITNKNETIVPIYYIDSYKDEITKRYIKEYKFENGIYSQYLLNILIDICIEHILENDGSDILFTTPPSTMFYRKEKDIDSMNNLLRLASIYINDYFNIKSFNKKIYFRDIFKINLNHLKKNKAQHFNNNRKSRTSDQNKYEIKNKYKKYIISSKIIILDDISTTGNTLSSCQKSLKNFSSDLGIELFSIAH